MLSVLSRRRSIVLASTLLPAIAFAASEKPRCEGDCSGNETLFDELMTFKGNPKFHDLGFAPVSPLKKWLVTGGTFCNRIGLQRPPGGPTLPVTENRSAG